MGNPDSGTPLLQMIMHCYFQNTSDMLNIGIVQYVIEKGAVLSRVTTSGTWVDASALELSMAVNRTDVAKMLVEKGLDPIYGGDPDYTPVFAEYLPFGSHHFLSWLLCEHFTTNEIPAFIDELIKIGAFTNESVSEAAFSFGRRPSHAFLLCGHQKAVHHLLDEKPDLLDECDRQDKTALHIAAEKGDLNSIDILLAK